MYRLFCAILLALAGLPLTVSGQLQSFSTIYGSNYHLVDLIPQGNTFFDLALDPPALCHAEPVGLPVDLYNLLHPGITRISDLSHSGNGDFHIAGEGSNGTFLLQTNFAYQPIWFRTYGGLSINNASVLPGNTGFILNGTATGTHKILVVKTNSTGIPAWSQTIDLSGQDEFPSQATQLDNGTVVVVGSVTRSGQAHRDAFVVQLSPGGAVLRALAFATGHTEVPLSVSANSAYGFLVSGYSVIGNQEKAFVANFDSTCTPLWSRQIMPDSISRATEMMGRSSVFTSISEVQVAGDSLETRILVQQWSEIGALTYANRLERTGINRPKSLVLEGAGHYLCGQRMSFGTFTGFFDKFMPNIADPCNAQTTIPQWSPITYQIDTLTATLNPGPPSQTDSLPFLQQSSMFANADCNTIAVEPRQEARVEVYPNPIATGSTNGYFRIKLEGVEGEVLLILRDIQGRRIWEQTANPIAAGSVTPPQRFALPQGGQGIYFLEIVSENGRWVKKILAQP